MAFIRVELMAIEHAEYVAQELRCKKTEVLGGLVELWQFSWKRKQDIHQISALAAWFSFDPKITLAALESFGFAEDLNDGTFRVRGADKYLRISQNRAEAGRKGGLKRASNMLEASIKQNSSKSQANARSDKNESFSEDQNQAIAIALLSKPQANAKQMLSKHEANAKQTSSKPPSTQITDHRSQITEKNIVADATFEPIEKLKKTRNRLSPEETARRKSLITALEASFSSARGSPYTWSGGRDFAALKSLLKQHSDSDILERWELGLKASGFLRVSNIGQLFSKFNDLCQLSKPTPSSNKKELQGLTAQEQMEVLLGKREPPPGWVEKNRGANEE